MRTHLPTSSVVALPTIVVGVAAAAADAGGAADVAGAADGAVAAGRAVLLPVEAWAVERLWQAEAARMAAKENATEMRDGELMKTRSVAHQRARRYG